jgi:hypothetical protein
MSSTAPDFLALAWRFSAFRVAVVIATIALVVATWKKPRPHLLLAFVIGTHLVAWLAYMAPLRRPYSFGEGKDRVFNVGMAAGVALGHSPFEHVQTRLASPEPFWSAVVGSACLGRPDRAHWVFAALTPATLVCLALALVYACRSLAGSGAAWDAALTVFSVLGLSSITPGDISIPPFWTMNFLVKPHHGLGFAVVALLVGLWARGTRRLWLIALCLGLLGWVFLMHWAYFIFGLFVATWLKAADQRSWRRLALVVTLAALLVAPLVAHLMRSYNPLDRDQPASSHMWEDKAMRQFIAGHWSGLDLGPLLIVGVAGAWVMWRRRAALDVLLLGLLLGTGLLWWGAALFSWFGIAPELDELHYFLRFAVAASGGAALAALGRFVESQRPLRSGQGMLLVFALATPLSLPAYWDPPKMDLYFPGSCEVLGKRIWRYCAWIRANVPKDAVFVAGPSASSWIPALTGRKVLLAELCALVPRDARERRAAELVLLRETDPDRVRAAARRWGITHLAIDPAQLRQFGVERFTDLAQSPALRTVFSNAQVRIVEIVLSDAAPDAAPAAAGSEPRPPDVSDED